MAQGLSLCLANTRPWVQPPGLPPKKDLNSNSWWSTNL
jgi:hypothetical protein